MERPLVGRKELARLVQEETGIPLSKNKIDKLASQGKGPPVAAIFGNRHLHKPDQGLEWAKSLLKLVAGEAAA